MHRVKKNFSNESSSLGHMEQNSNGKDDGCRGDRKPRRNDFLLELARKAWFDPCPDQKLVATNTNLVLHFLESHFGRDLSKQRGDKTIYIQMEDDQSSSSPERAGDADSSSTSSSRTPPRSGPLSAYQHHGASIYGYKALEDPLGRPISPFLLFLSLQKVCRYHERLYFPLLFIYFLFLITTISVQYRILQNAVVVRHRPQFTPTRGNYAGFMQHQTSMMI